MRLPILLAGLALAALAAACSAQSADKSIVAEPIAALDPTEPGRIRFGALEFRGGLRLSSADKGFGGWSAARLDGDMMTAVNDTGHWLRMGLKHDAGKLTGVTREAGGALRRLDGEPIGDNKKLVDSEGLTRWRDGYVVSFERNHRLWHYAPELSDCPTALERPAGFRDLETNGGVEAVTALADGRLLMLAEEGGQAWVGTPGDWHPLSWTLSGGFRPTDMARLPNGDVVVLERRFNLGGVGTRLSVVAAADIVPGAQLRGREVLLLEAPRILDNFEGVAVGGGPAGETMLYLLSDDNFSPLQVTLLFAFALVE